MEVLNPTLLKKFLIRFVPVYVVLAIVLPLMGLTDGYQRMTTKVFGGWYDDFWDNAIIQISEHDDPQDVLDTKILIINRESNDEALRTGAATVRAVTIYWNSRRFGYLPTVLILALIFAAPFAVSKRWLKILIGIVVLQLFVAFFFWVKILYAFHTYPWLEVTELSSFSASILSVINDITDNNIVFITFVALAIVTAVISGDIQKLLRKIT